MEPESDHDRHTVQPSRVETPIMVPMPTDGDDYRRLADAADRLAARRGDTVAGETETGESWLIEFEALPSDIPAPVRYRAMLKDALRRYKLRAVSIRGAEVANNG